MDCGPWRTHSGAFCGLPGTVWAHYGPRARMYRRPGVSSASGSTVVGLQHGCPLPALSTSSSAPSVHACCPDGMCPSARVRALANTQPRPQVIHGAFDPLLPPVTQPPPAIHNSVPFESPERTRQSGLGLRAAHFGPLWAVWTAPRPRTRSGPSLTSPWPPSPLRGLLVKAAIAHVWLFPPPDS